MELLEKQLDDIATELAMVEYDDLPGLARIHDQLTQLVRALETDNAPLAEMARHCADLMEKLAVNDAGDQNEAMAVLNQGVSGLQAVVRDNREFSEVHWPTAFQATAASGPNPSQLSESEPEKGGEDNPVAASYPNGEKTDDEIEPMIVDFSNADTSLLGEFLNEAREHCAIAEQMMLELETGSDSESAVNAIFRGFHTIKGAAGFLDLIPVSKLAHELETLLDQGRKGALVIEGAIADQIFSGIDVLRKLLDAIEEGLGSGGRMDGAPLIAELLETLKELQENPQDFCEKRSRSRVGDILVDMGATSQDKIDAALLERESGSERLGETLIKKGEVPAKAVAKALRCQKLSRRETSKKPAAKVVRDMVKVDTERLDRMVDTIGELVIAESMVGQDEEFLAAAPPRICKNVSHLNKITRELQEMGMAMRLVPVKATFQKLARAVRDLNRKAGKKSRLVLTGEDTEVDRSIVENIGDPLMHMIRNAVDHAIETPEKRSAAGKPETGTIWLRAFHQGGNIYFEIEDDGRGLDTEAILEKARERGLIDASRELSDQEIYQLIFHPGFSTAKNVTDISGRGVGMDVVRKNLDAMRGSLDVESRPGEGSKFTIKLPLTLAIIDGMLVRIRDERYIIPTISVIEAVHITPDKISTIGGRREMIDLRGKLIPLIKMAGLFNLGGSNENNIDDIVVVVENGQQTVGLVIDELLGQRQTVIKSLGATFSKQKWISGGAILADGSVGLIIDVGGVIQLAEHVTDSLPAETSSEEITTEMTEEAGDASPDGAEDPEESEIGDTAIEQSVAGELQPVA